MLAQYDSTGILRLDDDNKKMTRQVVLTPGVFPLSRQQVVVNFGDPLTLKNLPAESTRFFNLGNSQPVAMTTRGKSLQIPAGPKANFMENMVAAVSIAGDLAAPDLQCIVFMPLGTGGELSEKNCDVPQLQFLPDNTTFIFVQMEDEWVRASPDHNGQMHLQEGLMPVEELRSVFSTQFPDNVRIQIVTNAKRPKHFTYMYGQAFLPTEMQYDVELPEGMKFKNPENGILTCNTTGASFVSQNNTAITVTAEEKPEIIAFVTMTTACSGSVLTMPGAGKSLQENEKKLMCAIGKLLDDKTNALDKMCAIMQILSAVHDHEIPDNENTRMLLDFVKHVMTPAYAVASSEISTQVYTLTDGGHPPKRARPANNTIPSGPVRQASMRS